jgi:ABC-type amino acid transport substrate-binding protein
MIKRSILVIVFGIQFSNEAFSESISVAWTDWCPWNCDQEVNLGFTSQLVENVFAMSRITVQFQKYSWSVAINEVREGRINALLSPAKQEAEGLIYSKNHVAYQQMCFYVKKDFNWIYQGIKSLDQIKLGIMRNSNYPGLMDYIQRNLNVSDKIFQLSSSDVLGTGFEYLVNKKYDSFLIDSVTAEYYLKSNKKTNIFKRVDCLPKENLYIAFSPKNMKKSMRLVETFDLNFEKFIKTKSFSNLLYKYNLNNFYVLNKN